jgi:hypothetical protein
MHREYGAITDSPMVTLQQLDEAQLNSLIHRGEDEFEDIALLLNV